MPMDKERYVDTIQLCEMERDLEILGCGDLTEIGEKGINLSGGQKARVGLARALYANKDIYLLDDPISALDASVRRKIIENVIMTELSDKTRILVTHAIDFVHHADTLIIMEKGRIVAKGPFNEVKNHESYKKLTKINKLGDHGTAKTQEGKKDSSSSPKQLSPVQQREVLSLNQKL